MDLQKNGARYDRVVLETILYGAARISEREKICAVGSWKRIDKVADRIN